MTGNSKEVALKNPFILQNEYLNIQKPINSL